jgi:hypothetical protein
MKSKRSFKHTGMTWLLTTCRTSYTTGHAVLSRLLRIARICFWVKQNWLPHLLGIWQSDVPLTVVTFCHTLFCLVNFCESPKGVEYYRAWWLDERYKVASPTLVETKTWNGIVSLDPSFFGFDESHRMYYLNSMETKMEIWIDHSAAQISRHNEHWHLHQQAVLRNAWRWTENTSSPGSGLFKCTTMYFLSRLESLHSRVHRDNEMFNDEAHCFGHGDRLSSNYRQIYSIADLKTIIVDFTSGLRQ